MHVWDAPLGHMNDLFVSLTAMEREYEMTRFTVIYQNLKNMAQMFNKVSHYLKGKQGFIIVKNNVSLSNSFTLENS